LKRWNNRTVLTAKGSTRNGELLVGMKYQKGRVYLNGKESSKYNLNILE
jgi:hypothetical protein